jgi:hypothetical protein
VQEVFLRRSDRAGSSLASRLIAAALKRHRWTEAVPRSKGRRWALRMPMTRLPLPARATSRSAAP